jgi:hypothetical protein
VYKPIAPTIPATRAEVQPGRAGADPHGPAAGDHRVARLNPRSRAAVVAFRISADTELGDYDETPTILFRSGDLPPPFVE